MMRISRLSLTKVLAALAVSTRVVIDAIPPRMRRPKAEIIGGILEDWAPENDQRGQKASSQGNILDA
jgi:hypothetical protein